MSLLAGEKKIMTQQWYALHIYSGYEKKVKESVLSRAKGLGLEDKISEIMIPTEKVMEVRDGKRRTTSKRFFPGYILIKMEMGNEVWRIVKQSPGVFGFVGGSKPVPLSQEEMDRIVQQVETGKEAVVSKPSFKKGEGIRVIEGPFANFTGTVEEIYPKKDKLKAFIPILGRVTLVEFETFQVEKQ